MSFDLRHLRYVLAAAEHRSFFRAALELDIEQSSMSRAIRRLERRLGAKLFRRSHAGVSPTPAGTEFIRSARQILARTDELIGSMRSAGQGAARRLTIGYAPTVSLGRLNRIIIAWPKRLPDVTVELTEGPQDLLIAGLEAHVIDVAILPGDRSIVGMQHARLWSEQLAQLPIHFSAYWREDNDNPALRAFLEFVGERAV